MPRDLENITPGRRPQEEEEEQKEMIVVKMVFPKGEVPPSEFLNEIAKAISTSAGRGYSVQVYGVDAERGATYPIAPFHCPVSVFYNDSIDRDILFEAVYEGLRAVHEQFPGQLSTHYFQISIEKTEGVITA